MAGTPHRKSVHTRGAPLAARGTGARTRCARCGYSRAEHSPKWLGEFCPPGTSTFRKEGQPWYKSIGVWVAIAVAAWLLYVVFSSPAVANGVVYVGSNDHKVYAFAALPCTITGTAGNDTLTGTTGDDVICGLGGNDTLKGMGRNDALSGGGGNDVLQPGAGNDTVTGGAGTDTVNYADVTAAGVTVNLSLAAAQNTVGAGSDTITTTENASGTNLADALTGTTGNNTLTGKGGADTITGGDGNDTLYPGTGDDSVNGGLGTDRVSYADLTSRVTVNLSVPSTGGAAGTDTLNLIERATGTNFADSLTGNAGANILSGLAGNDVLHGGAGTDTLNGGTNTDTCIDPQYATFVDCEITGTGGTPPDAATTAAYSFEDITSTSTTVTDAMGHGHTAGLVLSQVSASTPATVPGPTDAGSVVHGKALSFDSSLHQQIRIPVSGTDATFDYASTMSAGAWVYLVDDGSVGRWEVFEKGGAYWLNVRGGPDGVNGAAVRGTVRIGGCTGTGSGTIWHADSPPGQEVPLNTWTHLAMSIDATNGRAKIYINGTLVKTQAIPATGITVQSTEPVVIGAKGRERTPAANEAWWNGYIDDVFFRGDIIVGSSVAN